jgi:hypothetical protein
MADEVPWVPRSPRPADSGTGPPGPRNGHAIGEEEEDAEGKGGDAGQEAGAGGISSSA